MVRNWLKELRLAKGLSAQALADLLNVSLRVVYAWEAGEKTPGGNNLLALSDVLGPNVIAEFQRERAA